MRFCQRRALTWWGGRRKTKCKVLPSSNVLAYAPLTDLVHCVARCVGQRVRHDLEACWRGGDGASVVNHGCGGVGIAIVIPGASGERAERRLARKLSMLTSRHRHPTRQMKLRRLSRSLYFRGEPLTAAKAEGGVQNTEGSRLVRGATLEMASARVHAQLQAQTVHIVAEGIAARGKQIRVPHKLACRSVSVRGRPATVGRDKVVAGIVQTQVDQTGGVGVDDDLAGGAAVVVVRVPAHQGRRSAHEGGGDEGGPGGRGGQHDGNTRLGHGDRWSGAGGDMWLLAGVCA